MSITLEGSGGGGGVGLTSWEGDFLSPLESTFGLIKSFRLLKSTVTR